MELCVMIEGQEGVSWTDWQAIAAACERHAIPALLRSDHYVPLSDGPPRDVHDAWGTVIALAATTTTLRLGTLVSPATFRHPAVFAKLAATADHVSGGRIEAGLGAGWHEGEHRAYGFRFPSVRERMDMFAEQLEIIRGLWAPGLFAYEGTHYRLTGVDACPKPVQQPSIPLIVGGAAKPRSAALAARFADEYNTTFARPDEVRARRTAVEHAWVAAHRSLDALRFSVMTGCVVGRDRVEVEDRRRALGLERVPEGWICGTPEEAARQLRALAAAGCDRVMLQLLLHQEVDQIALIGDELAQAVR